MSRRPTQTPMPQDSGFLVVRTPSSWHREFEAHARAMEFEHGWGKGWAAFREELRAAFPAIDPARYRGVDRHPIERWYPGFDALLPNEHIDTRELASQRRLLDLLGPVSEAADSDPLFSSNLLPWLDAAVEVRAETESPSEWDVVHVHRRVDDSSPRSLGFDVAVWGGGHYSILRDTVLGPQWHPPPLHVFPELSARLVGLNEHMLFRSADDARQFRAWYRESAWAETEFFEDAFQIIRIDVP